MCDNFYQECYKDYIVSLWNYYDTTNHITKADFKLKEVEYQL